MAERYNSSATTTPYSVALALPLDVQKIAEAGLIASDWQKRLPNNAIACTSVVALVFRPGNPKNIQGWDDLERCDD